MYLTLAGARYRVCLNAEAEHANTRTTPTDAWLTPSLRARIESVYAADYALLEYDTDARSKVHTALRPPMTE